ncbi:lasso peptide biosynthesis protein [Deltaproteobacteria bacterium]|nr:lasso peptide biosynthesis protein [Deltaproteobacteria bacterium]
MVKSVKGRYLLNISGAIIVAFWVVMMGLLIKKESFKEQAVGNRYEDGVLQIDSKQREWKEIYLNGRKVGYSINMIQPFETGYYIQEEILLKLNLMGLEKGLYTITQAGVDDKFILKNFNFKMNSGVVSYEISGSVEGDQLLINTGRGRRRRTQSIPLTEPVLIGAGMGYLFKTLKIDVGNNYRLPFFDPSTMSQSEVVLKVVGREPLKIINVTYDAFRVETEMWGRILTFWLDKEGTVLKEEGFMGLVMVKSSAANAPLGIEVGGEEEDDFYELTAVPVDRELPDPARLSSLKLEIKGIDDSSITESILNDGRQRYSDGIMEIRVEQKPLKATYSIPYDQADDSLKPFLEAEFNIESDMKEIREKALDIVGKEKDPVSASGKLLSWVYNNLDKKPVVSVPSALEVLETRVGDCNEHATLLTALLRASGIPARLSIGLVYNRNKFFYHAWTEAYVGEWISMDATLNQMPADVSHVRFMSGNLDKQVEIMGLIGKLKFEVIDFEYDRDNRSG